MVTYCLRKHFTHLKPLRTLVAHIDPASTVVVTYREVLNEAIVRCMNMKLPELPDFVLIDSFSEKPRDLNDIVKQISLDSGEVYNVRILAINEIDLLGDVAYCLYASQLGEPFGLWSLYRKWRETGNQDVVSLDVKPLSGYPLTRPPHIGFTNARFSDICTVYHALSDTKSCDIFLRAIKCIETGDPGYLRLSAYGHYKHPLAKAKPGDIVIEGGLADGKTTASFSEQVGSAGKVIGFEPLRKYVAKSWEQTQSCDNVIIENLGLWSSPQTFYIEDNGEASNLIDHPTEKSEECHVIDLDSYLAEKNEGCDLIKLDIEGAEIECLKGAMETIRKYRPKLQLSIYHHPNHYIDIPLMFIKENLDYDFYMGHHLSWFNETVFYASPRK